MSGKFRKQIIGPKTWCPRLGQLSLFLQKPVYFLFLIELFQIYRYLTSFGSLVFDIEAISNL